jgi:hypothetical protein
MTNEAGQQGLSIWDDEARKLGTGSAFFKMEEAVPYEVTFLDEGVDAKDSILDKKTGQTKDILKRVFKVKVTGGKAKAYNGTEITWDVAKGTTTKSLYGKLVELFQANKKAVGYTIHIVRDIGSDQKPEYKLLEWQSLDNARLFKK